MTNNAVEKAALAARKEKLLIDGAACRAGIFNAKATVLRSLRVDSLVQSAVEHAFGFASNRLESVLAPTGIRFQTLMPIAITAYSFLARRKLLKHAIGVGLIVAIAVSVIKRRKRSSVRR